MVSKKLKRMLVAVAAGAMTMMAANVMAQAPAGGPPRGPGGGMGMGMGAPADVPTTIERQGLNDPALKITAAQKAEIEKVTAAFVEEQKKINEKYPMAQGSPPSQEGMTARQTARTNYTAAVGKILNDEQRKTWEAAQAARRGGMGGPGGGMGGPGGGRGPGGAGGPPPGGA